MTMLLCWVLYPAVVCLVAVGCGLLVEVVSGFRLHGALLPPVGLALIVVASNFATATAATAVFAIPAVVSLSVAGYGLSYPWRDRSLDRVALLSAVGVFAVYAAPIVLSGGATFAGYITLDDTASWLALADHVLEHGRSLSGLAPSTYQQVLTDYLRHGYPLGAFDVLGLGGRLTGQDIAWVFQPTIALFAAMLGLSIYAACSRLVSSRPLRGLVAFIGAQPALLFAYAFWSGIKELAAACLIAALCALLATTMTHWSTLRGVIPAALGAAALLAVLGIAGGIWLIAPALIVLALLARGGRDRPRRAAPRLAAVTAVLSIPSIVIARAFIHGASGGDITQGANVANLGHPLNGLQVLGIWPATDFRVRPHDMLLGYILLGVLILAIAAALATAWQRRDEVMPLYLATGVAGFCLALVLEHVGSGSPWLTAKAMAEASPALAATALAGVAAIFETGRRTEATVAGAALAAGVLWSNGLAYANVWLAPRAQLAELQTIGQRFAGDGPTLMTEYQTYGARHFLRRLDPEATSERRRRLVLLRTGTFLTTRQYADLDAFTLDAVLTYRTLVLRRSPVESRPPSVYSPVWTGRWYEVWQRRDSARKILEHLSLGSSIDPAAVPSCTDVLSVSQQAQRAGGVLATVLRPSAPIVLDLSQAQHPPGWTADGDTLVANSSGTVTMTTSVPAPGRYGLWLGGSFRRTLTATVDGHAVSSVSDQLNNDGQWTPLGAATLRVGTHTITLRYSGSPLVPGSGGFALGMGPLVLSSSTAELPVTYLSPVNARSLCGRRLDWVEALGP